MYSAHLAFSKIISLSCLIILYSCDQQNKSNKEQESSISNSRIVQNDISDNSESKIELDSIWYGELELSEKFNLDQNVSIKNFYGKKRGVIYKGLISCVGNQPIDSIFYEHTFPKGTKELPCFYGMPRFNGSKNGETIYSYYHFDNEHSCSESLGNQVVVKVTSHIVNSTGIFQEVSSTFLELPAKWVEI